jgi:catalase-peroxidase
MSNETESKCPVMHGSLSSNSSTGTSNKDWWPNQLNLNILHQHDQKGDPMDSDLIMLKNLKNLIMILLKKI